MEAQIMYLSKDDLENGLEYIHGSPTENGVLELIVRRPIENQREELTEGELDSWTIHSLTYSYDLGLAEDEFGNYTDLGLYLGEYNGVSFSAHAGYYDYEDADAVWDYKLAASTSLMGVDWELAYTDNDDSDADEETVLLTVSKSL